MLATVGVASSFSIQHSTARCRLTAGVVTDSILLPDYHLPHLVVVMCDIRRHGRWGQ